MDNMAKILIILGLAITATAYAIEGPPNYVRTPLGDSIDKSSMKMLKVAYDIAENKNVVSSPLGLMMLLSLYNSGAGPVSREEITSFLGGTDFKKTSDSYMELSNRFSNLNPEAFTIASKVCVDKKYTVLETFQAAARSYKSDVDTVDFSKKQTVVDFINQWADEKTKGNIKNPVNENTFAGDDIAAALFNIIYFKGHWHVPFNAEETKEKDFHVDKSNVVKKPMMHLYQSLYYTESPELDARMVELPYKERGFRMVIVLPNEVDGLPSVLAKAQEKGLLNDVFRLRPAGVNVILDLPKFEVKTTLDLNNILPKLGVSHIFDEAATGIVKESGVAVSKAFQEAFIKVDEEGATAGAFTGMITNAITPSLPPPPIKFNVDHPFLYLILHEDKILFVGTYTQ